MPLISFFLSLAFASMLMPAILYFAHKKGLYDSVGERKVHNGNIPRLGGVGIAAAFLMAIIALMFFQEQQIADFSGRYRVWPVLLAGALVFCIGLVDDLVDLRARLKFFTETCATIFIIAFGFRFRVIIVPWGIGHIDLGLFSYPLTYIWVVGITNAMNLIDGIDGLAGGVSFIASLTFGLFFLTQGYVLSAEFCLVIAGAVAGFLMFNLPPAKIFMGDSGSLFLGFSMAALPLLGQRGGGAEIGLLSAATILAIPMFDTFAAMYRRTKAGVSFFTPDKDHIHHVLLRKVQSTKRVLLIMYGINVIMAAAALSTFYCDLAWSFAIKIVSLVALGLFFVWINRDTMRFGTPK